MTRPPVFDAHKAPVIGVDAHLPKVSPAALHADGLRARFGSSRTWVPEIAGEPRFSDRAPVRAAVLIPLVMRDEVTVLLTQRPSHMSSHAGQIAFPGGKIDATDANAIAAALRETHEEVGIESHFIQVLGELPVYTTGSGFLVTPVLGLLEDGFSLAPNPSEVSDVFEVPLRFLMDPAHHRRHAVEWAGMRREWLSMPYVDGNIERFIWGATAGMLRNLYGYMLT